MKQAAETKPSQPLMALVALIAKTHNVPSSVPMNVITVTVVILPCKSKAH